MVSILIVSLVVNAVLTVLLIRSKRPIVFKIVPEPDEDDPDEPEVKKPDVGAIERQGE